MQRQIPPYLRSSPQTVFIIKKTDDMVLHVRGLFWCDFELWLKNCTTNVHSDNLLYSLISGSDRIYAALYASQVIKGRTWCHNAGSCRRKIPKEIIVRRSHLNFGFQVSIRWPYRNYYRNSMCWSTYAFNSRTLRIAPCEFLVWPGVRGWLGSIAFITS